MLVTFLWLDLKALSCFLFCCSFNASTKNVCAADIQPEPVQKKQPFPEVPLQEVKSNLARMKVYNDQASAGIGNYLTDDSDEDYEILSFPADEVPSRADFGIRISGDSMEPDIEDGEIVWVEQQPSVDPGEIGIFVLNNESFCKRLRLEGRGKNKRVWLDSINDAYAPKRVYEDDNLRTIGRVLL